VDLYYKQLKKEKEQAQTNEEPLQRETAAFLPPPIKAKSNSTEKVFE
jgi:hypothetical protein